MDILLDKAWPISNKTQITYLLLNVYISWWRHQMEAFPALLDICAVTGEFSSPGYQLDSSRAANQLELI